MVTPLPLANALLVLTSTMFAMSLLAGVHLFIFYAFLAVLLSGQLVGKAVKG